ncbi:hypothetical protein LTR99_005880 [Exophiala xenobiotica]|uniref:Antifreeze protein n=1 Tax=Vermiconidia calcicola TaxID=1690605 RepID=A0AAV9QGE7_9PEZI|nr:hypothetical protein LTR92_006229 [Exophiala xenobiotica]KAK5541046.1 hypothetical protein LTR25_002823 [Vermiconidia calcicola]KAK5549461.1 hypothetical protein LTR23_000569 [Chaetothyriales sp. CCFEE 6169]KAK5208083.1 hypothetical protein LTR41_006019 [Exophiala xenobiotica]KAK5222869.1 hypothetical protein LTR72_005706 [Exophiala xenobiotica]
MKGRDHRNIAHGPKVKVSHKEPSQYIIARSRGIWSSPKTPVPVHLIWFKHKKLLIAQQDIFWVSIFSLSRSTPRALRNIKIQACIAFRYRSYLVAMTSLALLASLSTLLLHAYAQTNIATNTRDQTQIVSNGVTIIDGTTMSSCPGAAVLTTS